SGQTELTVLVETAVKAALAYQATEMRREFDAKLSAVTQQLGNLKNVTPEVEVYERIRIISGVGCDESLDIVKSIPDFDGKQDNYVSWRQAALTAYEVFEPYVGSSKHYQAVAIIRNKIKGAADATLASYNTVLNFKAIIARLDFTYADKTPVRVIQQELDLMRQGEMTLLQYYDEIEKKLTLLTNKTIMTHTTEAATVLNEKFRSDALHTF
ncbi:hypothetical protein KR222_010964, partial [Zaprionus bogoriensis]